MDPRISPGQWFKPLGPGVAHLATADPDTRVRSACGTVRSLLPTDTLARATHTRCPACLETTPEGVGAADG